MDHVLEYDTAEDSLPYIIRRKVSTNSPYEIGKK